MLACCTTAPQINMRGGNPYQSINAGSTTTRESDGTDYGGVFTALGPTTHTFQIRNTGTLDLTVTSIDKSSNVNQQCNNFAIDQTGTAKTVAKNNGHVRLLIAIG